MIQQHRANRNPESTGMTIEPIASNIAPISRPGLIASISRAMRLRCPRCGKGKLFPGYLKMHRNCPDCKFTFERDPGYFLGSTYINYALTAGITTVSYVGLHFGFGIPNSRLLPFLITFCGLFPVVFFRYARSLWLSLDCYFDRTGAEEIRHHDS